ncbi:hypothetical protein GIB67_031242, partial [Kingdonia uniflora]
RLEIINKQPPVQSPPRTPKQPLIDYTNYFSHPIASELNQDLSLSRIIVLQDLSVSISCTTLLSLVSVDLILFDLGFLVSSSSSGFTLNELVFRIYVALGNAIICDKNREMRRNAAHLHPLAFKWLRWICDVIPDRIKHICVSETSSHSLIMDVHLANMNRGQITLLGTAGCVMLSMHFTVQLLSQHLFYWKNPKEQKAIVIIILMAPLYAIVSFVGLLDFMGSATFFMFLESIKECYEALVIAKFLSLMYSYLNISISGNRVPDEIKGREIHHSFPMTLFQPHTVHLDHRVLKQLKSWTWQFVIIRPICSVLMILLQLLNLYPSWVSWTFTMILNISVSLALYSLVVFYHVFAKELEPHKPLSKFLCIKGIVFFCFWQGLVLELLVAVGVIRSHHFWLDVEHIQEAYQNILVCLEMVIFSVLQQYAYHVSPYMGDVATKMVNKKTE